MCVNLYLYITYVWPQVCCPEVQISIYNYTNQFKKIQQLRLACRNLSKNRISLRTVTKNLL